MEECEDAYDLSANMVLGRYFRQIMVDCELFEEILVYLLWEVFVSFGVCFVGML